MSLDCEHLEGSQNQSRGEESIREDFLEEEENSQFEGRRETEFQAEGACMKAQRQGRGATSSSGGNAKREGTC